MLSRTTSKFQVLALTALLALPGLATAGDSPIFVVGNWGVGEIDNRLMLYVGEGNFVVTPIPAPPHGPRWDIVYSVFPFVVVGTVAFWLNRRRKSRRGFAVKKV